MSDLCEMVDVRASLVYKDDDPEPFEDYHDVPCRNPATGTHENTVRVCRPCGQQLMSEGFLIAWDEETK